MKRANAAARCRCAVLTAGLWLAAVGVAAAPAQVRDWPAQGPPRPLPARDIRFPPYEVQTLPNGLQVVVVLHHEQPLVDFRLLLGAGAAADPKDKLGLAHLEAALLDQGTTTKSAQELADSIDFIGGSMKDSFETGMRMLSDIARHPGFAEAEIDRQRQQMLSGLRVSLEDPEYVANSVFDRLVYGFHPYGLPETGTPETIGSITRADLAAFDLYTRAKTLLLTIYFSMSADQNVRQAIELLDQAVARDPAFFEAYCQLVYAHSITYAQLKDRTSTRLRLAEAALQGATRLRQDAVAVASRFTPRDYGSVFTRPWAP